MAFNRFAWMPFYLCECSLCSVMARLMRETDEAQKVLEALHEFALLVQRFFPKNEERDSVIEAVNSWRRLTRIIDEAQA
jgi:hypothetical protein